MARSDFVMLSADIAKSTSKWVDKSNQGYGQVFIVSLHDRCVISLISVG